jgi:hypothetical protein
MSAGTRKMWIKWELVFIHKNDSDEKYTSETLLLACENNQNNEVWYLDSGASKHMTGNKNLFSKLVESELGQVKVGDDRGFSIKGIGDITIETKTGKHEKMSDVYYVPGLRSNLLSAGHLLRKGYEINLHDKLCILTKENQIVTKIPLASNNLFPIQLKVTNVASHFTSTNGEISKLWHDRYGHLNYGALKLLSEKKMVDGLPQIDQLNEVCDACQLGKQHRSPFPHKSS